MYNSLSCMFLIIYINEYTIIYNIYIKIDIHYLKESICVIHKYNDCKDLSYVPMVDTVSGRHYGQFGVKRRSL